MIWLVEYFYCVILTRCLTPAPLNFQTQVAIHQIQSDYPNGNDQLHVTCVFLHWHRLYMYLFELLMRLECGYTGRMTYWDEKVDAGNFKNAQIIKDFGGYGNEFGYLVSFSITSRSLRSTDFETDMDLSVAG